MVNYQDGKIYKLVNTDNTLCYVGSTTESLARRKAKHHCNYKCWKSSGKKTTLYTTSFKLFDNDEDGVSIILLEKYPCKDKNELEARERCWMDQLECVNKVRPTRTAKEYREDNADNIKEQQKQYREENAEKLKEKRKEYYVDNQCIYLKNNQVYYKNHKDRLKTKSLCECGGRYSLMHKSRHFKSNKHEAFMKFYNYIKTHDKELYNCCRKNYALKQ